MGEFSSWSYSAKATFWEVTGYDEYNQPSGFTRRVLDCSYKAGRGLAVDSTGQQFSPQSVFYLEAEGADIPKVGWRVKKGEIAGATPADDAEVVRMVREHDPSTFEEGLADFEVMT